MTESLRRIIRGLRWSERYGSHPGTPTMIVILALGAIAGGFRGVALMAIVFVPLYLYGAWERGSDD